MISVDRRATAFVVARSAGVFAGAGVAQALARIAGPSIKIRLLLRDGERFRAGQALMRVSGRLREILRLERTLLNLLGRMCGVATLTRAFVDRTRGTAARIRDTRKTTPGLRALEKYAVRCGGGDSHRAGLFDAFLAKDNHVAGLVPDRMAAAIARGAAAARRKRKLSFTMAEVDSLRQLESLLRIRPAAVDAVLLDNMSAAKLRKAVALRDLLAPRVKLEASGGVTLRTVGAIARSGVDFVSVGAITHSAPQIDLGLDIKPAQRRALRR